MKECIESIYAAKGRPVYHKRQQTVNLKGTELEDDEKENEGSQC